MARKRSRYQTNDGRYQKQFTVNGKKYCVKAKTREELEAKVIEKREAVLSQKEQRENPSLKVFYERWKDSRKEVVTAATQRIQQCHFNTISKIEIAGKKFEDYRITEIKADDIRTVQKSLLNSGNSAQTVNDKINFLSHIFGDAVKEQYIIFNPCSAVRALKRTTAKARDTNHRALTIDEQHRFFEASKESYYYNVFRFAINTGMRIGEIAALRNSDIYDGKIHVERTVTRCEDGSYRIGDYPKTESGRRTIPLNNAINEILDSQRKQNTILDGNISNIDGLIFKALERGLLMATPVDREIKRICKRTGIEHFTCHALRATFATRCIEQNMAPRTLQELLGHADYSLTMNLYGHVVDDTKEQAMSMIEIAL